MESSVAAFIFGLLGNMISFGVFLAPVPTFYTIWQNGSSNGYKCLPYSVAFFSASLLLFYAVLKTNAVMIVSINVFGCIIEAIYLVIYVMFAQENDRIFTAKLVVFFNGGGLGLIVAISLLAFEGAKRVSFVGWACAVVNVLVFAAPLSIMRQVIQTQSVEFMPILLSFALTACATAWFFYGFFIRDYYIAFPNVLGFLLGIAQVILYYIYEDGENNATEAEMTPRVGA